MCLLSLVKCCWETARAPACAQAAMPWTPAQAPVLSSAQVQHARHPAQKLHTHRTARKLQRSGAVCKLQAHGATRKPQPNSPA